MSMMWVGIGTAAVGLATNLYSTNAQKKSNQGAQNTNAELQDRQNDASWANWLMTRGIMPTTPTKAGQMPTSYGAVNTRLPLWANVSLARNGTSATGGMRLVKKGSTAPGGPKIGGLVAKLPVGAGTGNVATPGAEGATGELSRGDRILRNAMDPLNLMGSEPRTIGNVARRTLDPLGLFG